MEAKQGRTIYDQPFNDISCVLHALCSTFPEFHRMSTFILFITTLLHRKIHFVKKVGKVSIFFMMDLTKDHTASTGSHNNNKQR